MDDIRSPSEFLDSFKYTSCKENGSFSVVFEELAVFVSIEALSVEIVFIVDEIDLDASCCCY